MTKRNEPRALAQKELSLPFALLIWVLMTLLVADHVADHNADGMTDRDVTSTGGGKKSGPRTSFHPVERSQRHQPCGFSSGSFLLA